MVLLTLLTILAVISLAMQVSARRRTWRELDGYSFDEYLADFNLGATYGGAEFSRRQQLFHAELARVRQHNAKNMSWKEGINQFSVMTKEEKQAYFGRGRLSQTDIESKRLKASQNTPIFTKRVEELPKEVDWRTTGIVGPIKNQGQCGSCWAFAATATMESHVALNTGLLFDLSVQQTTSCTPNINQCGGQGGCLGATAELAFDYVASAGGLVEEYMMSYSSGTTGHTGDCVNAAWEPVATVTGYQLLPTNNYTALMNAVATVGPMAINVDASTFHAYESGVFSGCNQENPDVNHVVVLDGYGQQEEDGLKYWLIRNSWSPTYGEKGYIRILRSDEDDSNCGIDRLPTNGVACKDQPAPQKVCGTCGVIYDSSYPTGARLV